MPADPTRPAYSPVQRGLLTTAAGLTVAALAGAAFALTYDVLRDLARLGGVPSRWTPLYPVIADTLTALTVLSLLVTRGARWWTRLPRWAVLIVLVAGAAAISVQDAVRDLAELPRDAVRTGVAVAPHLMLITGVWLWLTMVKQIRVARPAAPDEDPPAETQRGHVKVLEPAAPPSAEPLALEAPTAPEPDDLEEPPAFLDDPEPLIPFPREEPEPEAEAVEDDPPVSAPALLPTDVELVRSPDRDGAAERPVAATTRPDIPMPAAPSADRGEDEQEPPADHPEDPDRNTTGGWNPPPSSNFRSGPTPPID